MLNGSHAASLELSAESLKTTAWREIRQTSNHMTFIGELTEKKKKKQDLMPQKKELITADQRSYLVTELDG